VNNVMFLIWRRETENSKQICIKVCLRCQIVASNSLPIFPVQQFQTQI